MVGISSLVLSGVMMENDSSRQIRSLLKESGIGDMAGRLPTISEISRLRYASEALAKLLPDVPKASDLAKALGLEKTNAAELAKQLLETGKVPTVWQQFMETNEEES